MRGETTSPASKVTEVSTKRLDQTVNLAGAHRCMSALYKDCLDELPSLIVLLDEQGRVRWLNRRAVAVTGYQREELIGRAWHDTVSPASTRGASRALFARMLSGAEDANSHTQTIVDRSGGESSMAIRMSLIGTADESSSTVMLLGQSLPEEEAEVCHGYDDLTGLPGRAMALDQLRRALATAKRKSTRVGIIFLDVDEFKTINDTIGHHGGDVVLQTVARRLQESVRQSDVVARLGGDEFLVILQEIEDEVDCEVVAEKVLEVFSSPVNLEGESLAVTTSMGITLYPDDGDNDNSLIAKADMAMYRSKQQGKNKYRFFTAELDRSIQRRLSLEAQLRGALQEERFVLRYQPIVDTAQGVVVGCEALMRWDRGDEGLAHPDAFIAVAEDSGLIVPMGERVLALACNDAVTWSREHRETLRITVNVSARQLLAGDLPGMVRRIIDESKIDPGQLEIELTESMLLYRYQHVLQQLKVLHELGVRLSLDDFGVGYSSLACLQQPLLDTVKIDGSRLHQLAPRSEQHAFCAAVTSLAHQLQRKVVAEGVETGCQLRHLQGIGVDYVQGRHLVKPLSTKDFGKLLGDSAQARQLQQRVTGGLAGEHVCCGNCH